MEEDAARVLGKMNNGRNGVITIATKVDGNTGSITHYEVDANGTVGNRIDLPPAKVVSGNSKAANLINSVSESIQIQKNVAAANRFLVSNADVVAKVGKVAGRGAVVVGIVADAYSIGSAYAEEGEFGDKTQQATGSAIGGAAGALAGAKLGAAIGVVGSCWRNCWCCCWRNYWRSDRKWCRVQSDGLVVLIKKSILEKILYGII